MPGIRYLDGELLDLVRDALTNDAARPVASTGARHSSAAQAADGRAPTLDANSLWQLGVLEMWLQSMPSQ